jgi:chromosome segregation ATPase
MLSRWLRMGANKRLERAAGNIGELETLRSRMAEIESALEARAEAELSLLRRLTDCRVQLELTRQRLNDATAQVADRDRSLGRERERADSAERRLADMTSGRARLHGDLEREHALRVLAEQTVDKQQAQAAEMEGRLRAITDGLERAVSTLSKRLAARRDADEQTIPLVARLVEGVSLLAERASPPSAPVREDQHLRFCATEAGYELSVAEGPPPRANTVVDCPGHGPEVVLKLGRSPLPADDRRCAYLLPVLEAAA